MEYHKLIACHECDLLYRRPPRLKGLVAHCSRCGAALKGIDRAGPAINGICALTVATLITFIIALAFPVIELEADGMTTRATLLGAVASLWSGQMRLVAVIVLCATVIFPLFELLALLYLLVPIRVGRVPRHLNGALCLVQLVRPWGMIEVFMLGVLVTIVKMVSLVRVIPDSGLFAFGALSLMFAVVAAFDPGTLWQICGDMELHRVPWSLLPRLDSGPNSDTGFPFGRVRGARPDDRKTCWNDRVSYLRARRGELRK
jgi:paraquat-inducible protein A